MFEIRRMEESLDGRERSVLVAAVEPEEKRGPAGIWVATD